MIFTVEETSLIQAMDHRNRRMAVLDIKTHYPDIKDEELKELCGRTIKKLDAVSDDEFAAIDFAFYEEDEPGYSNDMYD